MTVIAMTMPRTPPSRLLFGRHRKALIALRRDAVAYLAIGPDAADIGHENPWLAGNVGAHVPGIGLRIERGVRDLVDVRDPIVLGVLLCFHDLKAAVAHPGDAVGDPVDV